MSNQDIAIKNLPVAQPIAFEAEWPTPRIANQYAHELRRNTILKIVAIIIFPLFLIRLCAIAIKKSLMHRLIKPGQIYHKLSKAELIELDRKQIESYQGQETFIKTPDGVKIRAIYIPGTTAPEKCVLYVPGRGYYPGNSQDAIENFRALGVSVLMTDLRGVNRSEGELSVNKACLDVFTLYEFAIKELNFKLENMVGFGYSLGGGILNRALELVQQKYSDQMVHVVNARSFSSLTRIYYVWTKTILGSFCGCFFGYFLKFFAYIFDLNISSDKAFLNLKGRKCVIYSETDKVIPFKTTSLYKSIKKYDPSITTIRMKDDDTKDVRHSHSRPYNPDEQLKIDSWICDVLTIDIPPTIEMQAVS